MHRFLCACLALFAAYSNAQTATTTDVNGNTVVQVVTTDIQGNPLTNILQTITTASPTSPLDPQLPATTAVATPTAISDTTATTATTATPTGLVTVTPPPVQQGPVGQPDATPLPGGVTPYTYTTVIDGVTTRVADLFTPSNPPTLNPSTVGATGTILAYSEWLSLYGPKTTAGASSGAMKVRGSGSGALGLLGVGLTTAWLVLVP